MTIQAKLLCAAAASGFAALAATAPAQALTTQECSAKYQAAKSAGTLNGQKWNDFRKAQCGADATPVAAPRPPLLPPPVAEAKPKAARPHGGAGIAERACRSSHRDRSEIRPGKRRQGSDAYLRRPIQRQQGDEW